MDESPTKGSTENAGEMLLAAVQDTQEVIRAFDVKAEILGASLTIIIAVVQWTASDGAPKRVQIFAGLASLMAIVSLWGLARVIMPRKKAKWRDVPCGGYVPTHVFYPRNSKEAQVTVASLAKAARETDWVSEMSFELLKLTRIREDKAKWFESALWSAGLSYGLTCVCFVLRGFS